MTEQSMDFAARKKREIADLRVQASGAMAHAAYPYLDEAARKLAAMLTADDGAHVDDLIGRARNAIFAAEKKQG